MTKFKKGDKFIPRMTKTNAAEWNRHMKLYDGETLIVEQITTDGYIRPKDFGVCLFHPNWCEKVEDSQSVETNKMVAENHVPEVGKMVGSSEIPNGQESSEQLKTFYYRVEGMNNECRAEFSITAKSTGASEYWPSIVFFPQEFPPKQTTGRSTTLEQALKVQETPNNQEPITEVEKTIDWEQRRYELAKEVMLIDVSNCFAKGKFLDIAQAVKYAIICADEMIKQLKKNDTAK